MTFAIFVLSLESKQASWLTGQVLKEGIRQNYERLLSKRLSMSLGNSPSNKTGYTKRHYDERVYLQQCQNNKHNWFTYESTDNS
jgi:hypothetical protein